MKWTGDRVSRLADLLKCGLTYNEIGSFFGVSGKAIESARVKHGLPGRYRGWRPRRQAAVVPSSLPPAAPAAPKSDIPWPDKQRLMAGR